MEFKKFLPGIGETCLRVAVDMSDYSDLQLMLEKTFSNKRLREKGYI